MVVSFLLSIYWRLEVRMIRLAAISDLFTRLAGLISARIFFAILVSFAVKKPLTTKGTKVHEGKTY